MKEPRRKRATAYVLVGLLAIVGSAAGMAGAWASGAPGSNFGNVNITVTSTGIRSPFYSHSGEDVEGEAPYAEAQLQSGGVGSALTSVFWPGVAWLRSCGTGAGAESAAGV